MKHEKEIDQLLKDIFFEDWMDTEDFDELVNTMFKATKTTKQEWSDKIEQGVKNGYSIETQIKIIKDVLKHRINEN
jgi:hypothetical protein